MCNVADLHFILLTLNLYEEKNRSEYVYADPIIVQ